MERSPDDPQIEFFINLYLFCILVVKCQLEKIILKSKLKKRLEARDVIQAIVPILQLLSIKNDSSRLTPFRDFVLCSARGLSCEDPVLFTKKCTFSAMQTV